MGILFNILLNKILNNYNLLKINQDYDFIKLIS